MSIFAIIKKLRDRNYHVTNVYVQYNKSAFECSAEMFNVLLLYDNYNLFKSKFP